MQPSKPAIAQGWLRAIIFIIIYIGFVTLIAYVFNRFITKASFEKFQELGGIRIGLWVSVVVGLGCAFLSVWLCRRFIDRQSFASLGFAWKGYRRHALIGAFSAIAMIGIATIALIAMKYLQFTQWNIHPLSIIGSAVFMVLIAISEELVFRGYLLNNLMQSINKWIALLITAVLFAATHIGNPGSGILPIVEVFIAGVMLGINYIYTRNLWFGIFLHFTWNFFQGPILGYEVSGVDLPSAMEQDISGPYWLTGGAFGLEGSVLAVVLNLLLIAVLVAVYNRSHSTVLNRLLPD